MQSIKDNQVWVLVELHPNGRTVGSKWLFKKKTDIDGYVYTFKARLVAKGYTQTYGVDYGKTFSPVADIRAIRILLAIAAFYDYEIWQRDVKPAFLNGYLSEDVYMVQPEGFIDPKHPNRVCKLQRSIYGLKQASRSWDKRFDVEIKKIGFTQNPDEPCVYLKASGSNVAFLILYVDDILLIGNNVTMQQEKTLKKFRMKNSKKGYTLMIEKPDYRMSQGAKTPSEVQHMRRVPYASGIGSIIHFQQNHGEIHSTAVKTILKYLRNTKDMVLMYGANPEAELKVSCYANKSAKQSNTSMSSIKAEYIVVAEASMEAAWMWKFIDGLGNVVPSNKRPMEMLCDNEPAIAIANDTGILKGARHFQRKYHYIHNNFQQEDEAILAKDELSDFEETKENDDEIVEIFRIKIDIFDFESPLCQAFNELNYLLKIDTNLLTKDIPGFKTYDEFKDEWMDWRNKDKPWVMEKPWFLHTAYPGFWIRRPSWNLMMTLWWSGNLDVLES
ncbi:retrotransposon protein, putative, ty1-copia subclass [Tanacetum coccineum]